MEAMMEVPTNKTECFKLGNRWWVFLATIAAVYFFFLLLSSAAYGIYWLVKVKTRVFKGTTSSGYYFKVFRDFMRQLKSGDTLLGKILIILVLACNLAYLCLAFRRSLPIYNVEECVSLSDPEILTELVLVCVLLVYFFIRFLSSINVTLYWLNIYTIVDICTLPHIFISIGLGVDWIGMRFLRFIWLTLITTVLQFTPLVRSQTVLDAINLLLSFIILWLTSSGILHLIEAQGDFWQDNADPHSVLTYVYLTMVTMSTVGYGDFSPTTDSGRGFMILFIIGGLAFFAAILPKIVDITTEYYGRSQYAHFDRTRVPKYVIVCGHVTAITAEDFLKDFLHPDRGDLTTHVLFLHPERPDTDLKNVLRNYYTRVQFLLGSVLNGKDLSRAHLLASKAIFILANKHTRNPTEEDHANLLRVVSVKNTTDKIPVIIQLLHSFSKGQVENIEGWTLGRDIAVCLNELKLGLLAQSCLCPGFSTLIANLFYTSDFPIFNSYTRENAWKEHYIKGASNEVYSCTFSDHFSGMTFHKAAGVCFNKLDLVLLAIEHIEPNRHHYHVNPSLKYHPKLRIDPGSMIGYFIAQDQSHVSDVNLYCECCPGNRHVRLPTDEEHLKRELSSRRKGVIMRRSESPDAALINDNGDMIINFQSSVPGTPIHSLPTSVAGSRRGSNRKGSQNLVVELNQVSGSSFEACSGHSSIVKHGRSVPGACEIYICEPSRLEEKILNLDTLLAEDKSIKPLPMPNMQDHIILCLFADDNSPLLGLQSFLKPLRSKHLPEANIKPVVIICNKAFIAKEWPFIRNVPELYVVEGSPLLWSNLAAASVMTCRVCIVLTVLHASTGHEQAIDDKEAILCSLSIQKKLKNIQKKILVITDLREESNVQFLDFGDEDTPDERIYKAQPFACGEAFSVSMFDSVTSSAFHGPGTLYLVEDLIHSCGTKALCQVFSLPIHDTEYSGMRFSDFYNAQLKESNICMGMSRKLSPDSNQSYVITSPDPDLVLEDSDTAFILGE
jgi:potassium large conductance calcium-activated channel subfamily M alpha protein 1